MHGHPNYTVLKTYLQTKNANNVKAANSWNPWWLAEAPAEGTIMGQQGRTLLGAGLGGLLGAGLGGLGGIIKETFITPEEQTNYLRRILRWSALGGLGGMGVGALLGSTRYARELQEKLEEDTVPYYIESLGENFKQNLPNRVVFNVPYLGEVAARLDGGDNWNSTPQESSQEQTILADRPEFG